MREGIKTTEFWIVLAAGLFAIIQKQIWPEAEFPKESFIAIGLWVAARIGEKTFGEVTNGDKRAWQTSEFWMATGIAIIKYIFPAIPESIMTIVQTWIVGRPAMKIFKDFKIGRIGG